MDLLVNPRKEFEKEQKEKEEAEAEEEEPALQEVTMCDHVSLSSSLFFFFFRSHLTLFQPLAQHKGSEWNEFFKDSDMIYEIEKDVSRTFPHLHFFQVCLLC